MGMHLKIFDLLPKTDCRKCGQDTCLDFATGVSQCQLCLESCPDVADTASRTIRRIIAREYKLSSWLWGLISGVSKRDMTGVLVVLKEVFVLFPLRVIWLLLFTAPILYVVIVMFVLWLYNR